jgi:hypothetical protein
MELALMAREIASRIGMERLFCEIKVKYKRELE